METRYDSFCGLYCGACGVMLATETGGTDELARRLRRDPKDLTCHGCKQQTKSDYCRRCPIRACALERNAEFCFECSDYPCERLVSFDQDDRPHHSGVLINLDQIRRNGLSKWLEQQRLRWSCPSCGQRFSWYSEKCSACDAPVSSCAGKQVSAQDR